jgi:hypothetical protein
VARPVSTTFSPPLLVTTILGLVGTARGFDLDGDYNVELSGSADLSAASTWVKRPSNHDFFATETKTKET